MAVVAGRCLVGAGGGGGLVRFGGGMVPTVVPKAALSDRLYVVLAHFHVQSRLCITASCRPCCALSRSSLFGFSADGTGAKLDYAAPLHTVIDNKN
jgi:hypothetical protein